MPVQFKLPELGENIKGGTIVKVLVNVGDTVTKEQPVLEMETDKAVVEVPSNLAGRIAEIHVTSGDKAVIGQLIFTLEGAGAPAPQPQDRRLGKPASPPRRCRPPRAQRRRRLPPPAGWLSPPRRRSASSPARSASISNRCPAAARAEGSPSEDVKTVRQGIEYRAAPGRRRRPGPGRAAPARLHALGRSRNPAHERRPPKDGRAHEPGVVKDPPRDPVRLGGHHRMEERRKKLSGQGREGRRASSP